MDCNPPGSSVHGIPQARILEWAAISFSGDLPDPGIEPRSSALAGRFFTTEPTGQYFLFKFNEENCLILICVDLIIVATEHLLQLFAILLLRLTYMYLPHPSTVYSLYHLFEPIL